MDAQSYSRLLSYVVCELTMPVKKHVYNLVSNYKSSSNHHLLAAAARSIQSRRNRKLKNNQSSFRNISLESDSEQDCSITRLAEIAENFLQEETTLEETLLEDGILNKELNEKGLNSKPVERLSPIINDNKDNFSHLKPGCNQRGEVVTLDVSNDFDSVEMISNNVTHENKKSVEKLKNTKTECNSDFINECNPEYSESTETENGSSSSDEMSGFYSDPLLLCSERDFMIMFRMSRPSFQNLLEFVSKEEMEPIENVPLYKKVLIVLWLMGTSASYSDAAEVFSVTEEIAANCFFDVCATLYNRSESVIRWPDPDESAGIASRIEKHYGFPGVVGVLGCHYFSITIPKEALSRREHFNAKLRTYCISLQIVCDDRLVIRDIFPGLPGGKPEASVLRDSPLCEELTSKTQPLVEPNKHILARREYPQLMSMLTPYTKNNMPLNKDEVEFNRLHEGVSQLVDQTFKTLQDRFPTIKLLDPEVATMVLVAACVIHNICMDNGDVFDAQE